MGQPAKPILDGIRIATPCEANWNAMPGTDFRRHCAECGHDVYNISALTTTEAFRLLAGPDDLPCVRFYRRVDGTILTADCPVGLRASRWQTWRSVIGSLSVAVLTALMLAVGIRRDSTPWSADRSTGGVGTDPPILQPRMGVPIPELLMGKPAPRGLDRNPPVVTPHHDQGNDRSTAGQVHEIVP